MNCLHCKIELINQNYCPNCAYPNNGTLEEKSNYVSNEILKREVHSNAINANKKSRILILLVGLIYTFLSYFIFIYTNPKSNLTELIAKEILGLIFLILWIFSKKKPYLISIVALILFLTFNFIISFIYPENILKGIVLKTIILSTLTYGLYSTYKLAKLKRKYDYLL